MTRTRSATMKLILPAVILLALAGCATRQGSSAPLPQSPPPSPPPAPSPADVDAQRRAEFNKSLGSWHGAKTTELQAKLGPPTSKAKQADGKLVYAYVKTAKVSNFSCVVLYLIDEKSNQVVGHRIEGC